jgi:hypothetical protein
MGENFGHDAFANRSQFATGSRYSLNRGLTLAFTHKFGNPVDDLFAVPFPLALTVPLTLSLSKGSKGSSKLRLLRSFDRLRTGGT